VRLLCAVVLVVVALLLVAFLLLVRPAWSAPSCLTYEEKTLGRWQTLCDDGTRAVSTDNRTRSRWERAVTSPPANACTGRLTPVTTRGDLRGR
jgi:hypothetical protein